jgi:hypothetical protein
MLEQQHLTSSGLAEIANIKASMNFVTISDSLQSKFPNIKPIPRPPSFSFLSFPFLLHSSVGMKSLVENMEIYDLN